MSFFGRIAAWWRSTQVGFPIETSKMTDDDLKSEYTKIHSDLIMYGELSGIPSFRMSSIEDELKTRRIYVVPGVSVQFIKY